MTSPYRNEKDALRERKESLEREIARLRAQTTELEALRSREQELSRELSAVAASLGAGSRRLPMLDQLRVASPCNASWDEMVGGDRVRFCVSCEKSVYNLSAMSGEDAERLLRERAGGELCVRYYQRADGTVMTEDCPVGAKKKRRRKLAVAALGAGAMAFAAAMSTRGGDAGGTVMQGAIASPMPPDGEDWTLGEVAAPSHTAPPHAAPPHAAPPHAAPPHAAPPETAVAPPPAKPARPALMGRRAR